MKTEQTLPARHAEKLNTLLFSVDQSCMSTGISDDSNPVIELEDLSYRISNGRYIYQNLSLKFTRGAHIGLLGRNGTGKTTLLDLIVGFKSAVGGKIRVFGEDPIFSDRGFLQRTAYVSQDIQLDQAPTVQDFVEYHALNFADFDHDRLGKLLQFFKIETDQAIGSLSTGYRNLTQLVMQMARNPELVIIDEVTAVLDPENRARLHHLMQQENKERNTTVIIATNIAEELIGSVREVFFIEKEQLRSVKPTSVNDLFDLTGTERA